MRNRFLQIGGSNFLQLWIERNHSQLEQKLLLQAITESKRVKLTNLTERSKGVDLLYRMWSTLLFLLKTKSSMLHQRESFQQYNSITNCLLPRQQPSQQKLTRRLRWRWRNRASVSNVLWKIQDQTWLKSVTLKLAKNFEKRSHCSSCQQKHWTST